MCQAHLEHRELQEDAPAGSQHICILIRRLRSRLTARLPNFLKEPPSSSVDASVLPC